MYFPKARRAQQREAGRKGAPRHDDQQFHGMAGKLWQCVAFAFIRPRRIL